MKTRKTSLRLFLIFAAYGITTNIFASDEHNALTCADPAHLHYKTPEGEASQLYKPELSAVVDAHLDVSDQGDRDDGDEQLQLDSLELQVAGYLAPKIHGTAVLALEQEYVDGESETETELEEAYLRLFDLPGGFEIRVGRMLVPFGMLNQSHSHEWMFADVPAAFEELFGDHAWFDDGIRLQWSNQAEKDEWYLGLIVALLNGREPGHGHHDGGDEHGEEHEDHDEDEHDEDHDDHDEDEHDEDHDDDEHGDDHDDHDEEELVEWEGKVWLARVFSSLQVSENLRLVLGSSVAGDEGADTVIAGADLTLVGDIPGTLSRWVWQTEVYHTDQEELDSSPTGLFSVFGFDVNHRWQVGGRYDWTERLADDSESLQAGAAFLTYRLAPHALVRGQFKHVDPDNEESENVGTLQLVWSLGVHGKH